MLAALIAIPLLGGLLALAAGRVHPNAARWTALLALAADFVLLVTVWQGGAVDGPWLAEWQTPWIPDLGVSVHLGLDGLSAVLVALTLVLGLLAVGASWTAIEEKVGFFHLNLLWVLGGIVGVFLALDLFVFYLFWELMLVPMYLLIGIWGHEHRVYAATKFFLFTQASGLLMFGAIVALAFLHRDATGAPSFDYEDLMGTTFPPAGAFWCMMGFVAAFVVKLPAVPFHTWLPDAHGEAPTAGSVILAGLLLKTGAYGLLRFALPLFPEASADIAPAMTALGAAGVLYGAVQAFGQTDLKRLIAYTSVSHMGFVLLGVYAALLAGANAHLLHQGVVFQMVAHGLATGGLFVLAGMLIERTHTRDLGHFGRLWTVAPRMGAAGLVLAMAALGLPGLASFVAEFVILLGAWQAAPVATAFAVGGMVLATVYALRFFQRTFHGSPAEPWTFPDLTAREVLVLGVMIALLVWLGLNPQPVFDAVAPTLARLAGGAP
ncbi:MAG: complex I subunit 4 family protein [Myxococcota bacterium]